MRLADSGVRLIWPAEPGGTFLVVGHHGRSVLALGATVDGRPRLAVFDSTCGAPELVEMFSYQPDYDRLPRRIPWVAYRGGVFLSPYEVFRKLVGMGFDRREAWGVMPKPDPPA